MTRFAILTVACAALLSACATPPEAPLSCFEGAIRLDQSAPGQPASPCARVSASEFVLTITPEAEPINPSPWYAFTVISDQSAQIGVTLRYAAARHRYAPWIEAQDEPWLRLDPRHVRVTETGAEARLSLDLDAGPSQIAAQPVYPDSTYAALESRWGGEWRTFGTSHQGRALRARIDPPATPQAGWILILGRQHPPEIPGAWALEDFAETLIEARAGGAIEAGLIIAPLLNPDGVAAGHWRLNAAQTDLNRDWADRRQPEIQAVYRLLETLEIEPGDLELMVDFHATVKDVIYLPQQEELPPGANARLEAWIAAMETDGLFALIEPERTNPARRVSAKAAFTDGWGAVAVTWEAADDTPEAEVREIARRGARQWVLSQD
jgi:predicted deacylase